jgi:hypothetical protein
MTEEPRKLDHVVIVGLGPSRQQYMAVAESHAGRHNFCGEVWGINSFFGVLQCDRVFHMDDVRIQLRRAKADPTGKIAKMVETLRKAKSVKRGGIPIYTSRAHRLFPALVAYPLEDVLNSVGGLVYFNSTPAYAIALAIHLGVKRLTLFGLDYTYANAHEAEKGRACCEYWCRAAIDKGIDVQVSNESTLLDANVGRKLYGYDTVAVTIGLKDGKAAVRFQELPAEQWPGADEIEKRYFKGAHLNGGSNEQRRHLRK